MTINQENIMKLSELILQNRDNLFNADHRRVMIKKYGATEAMFIKIEDLL